MKIVIVLAAVAAVALSIPADTYNPAYDSFNAQELVDNVRLLKIYGNCFLDKGRCSPQGNDFKKVVPEAIKTDCAKCTPKQRELIRIVVRAFREKLPDVWADLVKKEDPKGQYKEAFERFLNSN